eukprot:scaffold23224_cov31-Tisochrysis_lutea.AAC.4
MIRPCCRQERPGCADNAPMPAGSRPGAACMHTWPIALGCGGGRREGGGKPRAARLRRRRWGADGCRRG